MEEAKTAAEQTKERSVRFPVQKAARRTLVSFVLYAVLFSRMRLIAGLLAAVPFLCGLLFFEEKTNTRRAANGTFAVNTVFEFVACLAVCLSRVHACGMACAVVGISRRIWCGCVV